MLSSGRTKRTHTRQACDACKTRKRKCDGQKPCSHCIQHDLQCTFLVLDHRRSSRGRHEVHQRKAVTLQPAPVSASATAKPQHSTSELVGTRNQCNVDANAGVLFSQTVKQRLCAETTTATAASETSGFAWNLGLRSRLPENSRTIVQVVTQTTWQTWFDAYIRHVHPFYGFVNIETALTQASSRWNSTQSNCAYDHVLCGIAALGALFSPGNAVAEEQALFSCAQELLISRMLNEPTFEDVQAWLLRTIYLRCTSPPHISWLASCTTMHIIEAVGVHRESVAPSNSMVPDRSDPKSSYRNKAFWLARLLNTWISWEYGRTNVTLRDMPHSLLDDSPEDHTCRLIKLFELSQVLEPGHPGDAGALESALLELVSYDLTETPLVLSQSTLSFALYRRLRLASPELNTRLLEHIIMFGRKGLQAALSAARAGLPWWHVSNVPFQFVCVLIIMDTTESISYIHEALFALRIVKQHFDTPLVRRSLDTAESLVTLYKKRKQHAVNMLENALDVESNMDHDDRASLSSGFYPTGDATLAADTDTMWLDNLLFNFSSLDNTDWSQF